MTEEHLEPADPSRALRRPHTALLGFLLGLVAKKPLGLAKIRKAAESKYGNPHVQKVYKELLGYIDELRGKEVDYTEQSESLHKYIYDLLDRNDRLYAELARLKEERAAWVKAARLGRETIKESQLKLEQVREENAKLVEAARAHLSICTSLHPDADNLSADLASYSATNYGCPACESVAMPSSYCDCDTCTRIRKCAKCGGTGRVPDGRKE